ncbi:MAG: YbbR-like domain-containing protein [Pseudodesulfovibrio sp.]|uniref:YbbR family protein n=1 Tax=Pseudodesulfovibrio aespoeensis (strain ATCC 700646 / DSM 10631 / Aspo-2) TaxID=643562 RepID=E6VUN1_PSEA9|nr:MULTISPECIES: CdaR family protein [Pseudodesulfovibrio]MBU4193291.1 YbbR-like domain-containing protein [Pseudomonadota bacterium]ADU62272.1 YbbR family protein [Pseudodesulfovibrio aespoeensis Aspo-2]MBU4243322.1 YbbR-like domain-containing protein [Pseudomonadota bacterium]MBU4380488.1 YbbR-like domain-containing protein [Pseudomonadota bacterium]MBU4474063.1 YbbR-like domain-containing protein [Pseudomonadota bacterium]
MKNWQTMLLALALAIFTWFLVTGREVIETWVEMPVIMTNPPEGMIIEEGMIEKIQVRLRGPKGLVGSLASQTLTYPLDVSKLSIGQQVVEIDASKLPFSSTYEIIEVRPNRLKLVVDRRTTKTIPLEAAWSGQLNPDYVLREVRATPSEVEIRGPETKLGKITATKVVLHEDFLENVPEQWAEDVGVELPDEIRASPGKVRVEAFFSAKTREIWVKLPLSYDEPRGYGVAVAQDFVRLLIDGPIALFRNNDYRTGMVATLVFPEDMAAGRHELDYQVALPEGCQLMRKNPETISITLTRK